MTGPFLLNNELYLGEEGNTTDATIQMHALNAQSGIENWYATVPSPLGITGQMQIAGG